MTTLHPWLRCLHGPEEALLRLVCIPHAGSGASAFRDWAQWIPAGVALYAVQLPGREDRRGQPPPPTLLDAASLVAEAMATLEDQPCLLLGHSFGALLGFETVRVLETQGRRLPCQFVASGASAPHRVPPDAHLHRLDDRDLLKEIERYGGVPEVIRRTPDFFAAFAPVLRADFLLSENYEPAPGTRIATPLLALGGLGDSFVPLTRLIAWQTRAAGPFAARAFPGGHFYLHDDASGFAVDFAERLARWLHKQSAPALN